MKFTKNFFSLGKSRENNTLKDEEKKIIHKKIFTKSEESKLKEGDKQIPCEKCDGFYQQRNGKFGYFAGCSNYPKCKSTIKLDVLFSKMLELNKLSIYSWEIKCWKCHNKISVYTYFLCYQWELFINQENFLQIGNLGLSDIEIFDKLMMEVFPTIKPMYSRTIKEKYVANTCEHCDSLQGYNFVVDDPHEIMWDLHTKNMEQYLHTKIDVEITKELLEKIRDILRHAGRL